jgi:uncharacterized protein DUF6893
MNAVGWVAVGVIGAVVLGSAVIGVRSIPDLQRYLKMRQM